jgi:hypothetical protein
VEAAALCVQLRIDGTRADEKDQRVVG